MKIEFRKVPIQPKEFTSEFNSVKFCGTFGKISSSLVDINATMDGKVEVNCCKCGEDFTLPFNEDIKFLISDGVYLVDETRELDKIIIEIDDGFINFDDIVQSEIESFKSDYHLCDKCKKN